MSNQPSVKKHIVPWINYILFFYTRFHEHFSLVHVHLNRKMEKNYISNYFSVPFSIPDVPELSCSGGAGEHDSLYRLSIWTRG